MDVSTGGFVALGLFFLLRLVDEWKDREEDARWRPYRPVPRGLVGFSDLVRWGAITLGLQVGIVAVFAPSLWIWTLPALLWLVAMSFEFGIGAFLRRHPFVYAGSHMLIMPLFDLFSTAIDWHPIGRPPAGVEVFLLLSYLNGFVLEIGRKIRASADEEPGVETYSVLLGARGAAWFWLATLGATGAVAAWACWRVSGGEWGLVLLAILFPAVAWSGFSFLKRPDRIRSSRIEKASAIWSLCMYVVVGAAPALAGIVFGGGTP